MKPEIKRKGTEKWRCWKGKNKENLQSTEIY